MLKVFTPHIYLSVSARRDLLSSAFFICVLLLFTSPACAAKILIVGDTQYAMVADIVSDIQSTLRMQSKEYATSDVKGRLNAVVEREDAQIVVALGVDAVAEALRLPPEISVVYGLVVAPPRNNRENITGVYMAPPVSEYVSTLRRYLPALSKISVVGSQNMVKSLSGGNSAQVTIYNVGSSSELVNTVNRLSDTGALLLLPDANLLTAPIMSNVFLFSFKKNIPLLGISEAHVKQGSLFALVFDNKAISRQIGEKVQAILNGGEAGDLPASPPKKYNLYINGNTAQKMGIEIPDEMFRKAKKVY